MSMTEILLILAIALVVLGPERLPPLARGLGKAMREFRKATREMRATLEVEEVRRTLKERIDIDKATSDTPDKPETGARAWAGKPDDDLAEKKTTLDQDSSPRPVSAPAEGVPVAHGETPAKGAEVADASPPSRSDPSPPKAE